MKKKKFPRDIDSPLAVSDLIQIHNQGVTKFMQIWTEGDNNERSFMGKNWTPQQEIDIKAQDRQPYSFPLIANKLQIISATQKKTRTSFKVEAVSDPNDEMKADLATILIKDVEKQSKFKYLESDVFDRGLMIKYGVSEIYLDWVNAARMPKVRLVDWKNFIWDSNSKVYDRSDSFFDCKIEKIYRYQLEAEGYDTTLIPTQTTGSFLGRNMDNYYITHSKDGHPEFDVITLFHHYQKVNREYHVLIFPDSQGLLGLKDVTVGKFRSKKDAEMKARELDWEYISKGLPPESKIEVKNEQRYDYYKFVYNMLLEYEETELEKTPFNVFFTFFLEGECISMMDFLKSPQLYMDRVFSQIDYSLGRALKGVKELNVDALPEAESPELAQKKMNKTGGVILKHGYENVISVHPEEQLNPAYFEIFGVMQKMLEDLGGGRSFQGLAEGKSESGVSVEAKKQQGQMIALNFVDNLSRWKQGLGENILWWVKNYVDTERYIKVQGGSLEPQMIQMLQQNNIYVPSNRADGGGYVKINDPDNQMSFLNDAELELVVTEAELTETERQLKYMQMQAAEKVDPTLAQSQVWLETKLKYMDIDASTRQKLLQERQQIQQQNMQMQQQQAQLEQANLKQDQDLKKAEILMKLHIADSTPKTVIAYKDTPDDIKRQLEEEAGMTPSKQPEKNSNTPKPITAKPVVKSKTKEKAI